LIDFCGVPVVWVVGTENVIRHQNGKIDQLKNMFFDKEQRP